MSGLVVCVGTWCKRYEQNTIYIRKSPLKTSERRQIILNSSLVDGYDIKCNLSSTQERKRNREREEKNLKSTIISDDFCPYEQIHYIFARAERDTMPARFISILGIKGPMCVKDLRLKSFLFLAEHQVHAAFLRRSCVELEGLKKLSQFGRYTASRYFCLDIKLTSSCKLQWLTPSSLASPSTVLCPPVRWETWSMAWLLSAPGSPSTVKNPFWADTWYLGAVACEFLLDVCLGPSGPAGISKLSWTLCLASLSSPFRWGTLVRILL